MFSLLQVRHLHHGPQVRAELRPVRAHSAVWSVVALLEKAHSVALGLPGDEEFKRERAGIPLLIRKPAHVLEREERLGLVLDEFMW